MAAEAGKPYIQDELVTVGESRIHGMGLFAASDIQAGTELGRCRAKKARKEGPHVLWLSEDKQVKVVCDLRYINHHRHPNVVCYDDLTVVALRDIEAGEELFHHYGDEWEQG